MDKQCATLLLAFLLFSCKSSPTNSTQEGFLAFYIVQDTTLSAYDVKQSVGSVSLVPTPLFTVKNITTYHWSTHTFEGTASFDSLMQRLRYIPGKTSGLPFVIVVGSDRVYVGAFWYPYSSQRPTVPYIDVYLSAPYQISRSPADSVDVRNDVRVRQALDRVTRPQYRCQC